VRLRGCIWRASADLLISGSFTEPGRASLAFGAWGRSGCATTPLAGVKPVWPAAPQPRVRPVIQGPGTGSRSCPSTVIAMACGAARLPTAAPQTPRRRTRCRPSPDVADHAGQYRPRTPLAESRRWRRYPHQVRVHGVLLEGCAPDSHRGQKLGHHWMNHVGIPQLAGVYAVDAHGHHRQLVRQAYAEESEVISFSGKKLVRQD
jgi:hypothetical protein